MRNYVKATEMLSKGIAHRHYTFEETGIIIINLNNPFYGIAYPNHNYIDVVGSSNSVVDRGNITDDLAEIRGAGKSYSVVA